MTQLTVCVCGGGNGAHCMAGLSASRLETETRVLTLFQDESERWAKEMKHGGFFIKRNNSDNTIEQIKPNRFLVTNNASEAITGANIIILCVPAFAHKQYFETIKDYIQEQAIIVGLPGQPGFELQCFSILGKTAAMCTVMNYETLPWACRIQEFGKVVEILGTKRFLMGSIIARENNNSKDSAQMMQSLLGSSPILTLANNYLETYLATKSIVHPPLMHAKWKDWDGKPLQEKPLFYQGLNEAGADSLSALSDELVATARAISVQKPELRMTNVGHLLDWYRSNYKDGISDPTNLLTCMKTNAAYNGLLHPMKAAGDGLWVPNFQYRYLAEDVPFGLVVTKGLALLAGVPTPETDKILNWSQQVLNKEYLRDGQLNGKDILSTRCPQAFGYKILDDLVALIYP